MRQCVIVHPEIGIEPDRAGVLQQLLTIDRSVASLLTVPPETQHPRALENAMIRFLASHVQFGDIATRDCDGVVDALSNDGKEALAKYRQP